MLIKNVLCYGNLSDYLTKLYELGASSSNDSDRKLKNCLFGAVTLTKHANIEKYGILVIELDLIKGQAFHFLVVDLVKMY